MHEVKCYLDIETSGLSINNDEILIVGLLIKDHFQHFIKGINLSSYYIDEFIMMYEPTEIVTYNGIRFDVPFLVDNLGCETLSNLNQKDLMILCHNNNIKGGLKKAEQYFGIERTETPLNYFQQRALWKRWDYNQDEQSLNRILKYNEDDVRNLQILEEKLDNIQKRKDASYSVFKKAFLTKNKNKKS